jgi:hypothetical protein
VEKKRHGFFNAACVFPHFIIDDRFLGCFFENSKEEKVKKGLKLFRHFSFSLVVVFFVDLFFRLKFLEMRQQSSTDFVSTKFRGCSKRQRKTQRFLLSPNCLSENGFFHTFECKSSSIYLCTDKGENLQLRRRTLSGTRLT